MTSHSDGNDCNNNGNRTAALLRYYIARCCGISLVKIKAATDATHVNGKRFLMYLLKPQLSLSALYKSLKCYLIYISLCF